jgi:hypothetical protein
MFDVRLISVPPDIEVAMEPPNVEVWLDPDPIDGRCLCVSSIKESVIGSRSVVNSVVALAN